MGELIPLAAIVCIFGPALFIPITAMVLRHRKEMLEMELERRRLSNQEVVAQIEAIRQELAQLRDTSTQYDMSLQMTLETLQERVRLLEQQLEEQTRVRAF
jgi:glucose-6-phosphate-specific signal transduction histidine kinase